MADTGTAGESEDQDGRSRILDRWGRQVTVGSILVILISVGVGAWILGSNSSSTQVLVEAADSVGADPFTTDGITLAAASTGTTKSPGLFGGSGDNGVCTPAMLIAFLESEPAKAQAWVAALNADPTLRWSGGSDLSVADIPAYISELTPAFLSKDTRVTNHGFKDGVATPRQSLLEKGTAVLVDAAGDPRVRCFCGNPLHPQAGDDPVAIATVPAPTETAEEPPPDPTPTPEETTSSECIPDLPETDGCGPEPPAVECNPVGPVPGTATDVTTAPIDLDGTAPAETLRVYFDAGVWRVRVEAGGVGLQDVVLAGPGPTMSAIGGASVDNIPFDEAWVKVGSGSATDIVGLIVFRDCTLHRVLLGDDPAEFPVGITGTAADGVACFGSDTGIEVFTTTSADGVTYTGTSSLYTIDPGTPISLTLGATANQSQTTSDGSSFTTLHTFQCDSLNTIP